MKTRRHTALQNKLKENPSVNKELPLTTGTPTIPSQPQTMPATKAETLPVAQSAARGFESGLEQEDLIIPRAKLIQALSPEAQEGIKAGTIINSLTKEALGDTFVPIFMYKNYAKFNPRSKAEPGFDQAYGPGALMWMTTDALDPRVAETKFGPNGEKPTAVSFMNFFSYFSGQTMPVVISFSKTSYNAGKQLLSLAKFCGGDIFSRRYKLTAKLETNDIANYWVYKVEPAGMANPDELKLCEGLWKDFSHKPSIIRVHTESMEEEVAVKNPIPF